MKIITILLLAFILYGCDRVPERTELALDWVSKHQKPIECRKSAFNMSGETRYTLIDSSGNIYDTGYLTLNLPDTLKLNHAQH